jgi:light-regulated signal transduction histidine kinase (bacteriophytochrome)
VNQIFLVFVLGGMMLGAASVQASRPEAFLAFLLLTSLPVVVRLLIQGDKTHFAMAFLAAVFTAAIVITTGRVYRTVDWSLRLQFENRDLLEDLDAAKQETDALNMALERKVEERTADLRSANEKLLRANGDLEQFAYSASHDLQEPLRSIKLYSELLSMTCREKLDGEALQAFDLMRTGATRMELLLSGLLSYIQASRCESPAEPIDAGNALRAALENLAGAIAESGANIHVDALPSVRILNTQLQQLFQNLIGNAIKYRKPGVPPVIDVSAERRNSEWRFMVKDNGIGIEDAYKERVFGLFKRLHTQHEYTGTGIGLALCQRIVEHYQGRIWVESKSGEGSTFYFTVPG